MILYFDTFITDIALSGRRRRDLVEDIRKNCQTYAMPKRADIAKYSLASYALYPWSEVLIKYKLEDPKGYKNFDKYIFKLFPKALVFHERSDSQEDYKESFEILSKMKDDWIFYSPNNDQPLITSDKKFISYIDKLIKKAERFRKNYEFVSIIYSFFTEFINLPVKGTPINLVRGRNTILVEEDKLAKYYIEKNGCFDSIQIVDKKLFKEWFVKSNLENKWVIRTEEVENFSNVKNQLLIVPKRQLCAHFDMSEHWVGSPVEIQPDVVPPLFIPEGFFTNSIKIAYGYDKYRRDWVNINPKAKKYNFRDSRNGTDLKINLEEIPLFWKERIREIDINKYANLNELKKLGEKNKMYLENPWKNLKLNTRTIRFFIKLNIYKFMLKLGLVDLIGNFQMRNKVVYKLLRGIVVRI